MAGERGRGGFSQPVRLGDAEEGPRTLAFTVGRGGVVVEVEVEVEVSFGVSVGTEQSPQAHTV